MHAKVKQNYCKVKSIYSGCFGFVSILIYEMLVFVYWVLLNSNLSITRLVNALTTYPGFCIVNITGLNIVANIFLDARGMSLI